MQHLVRGNVVQDEAHGVGGVQPGRYGDDVAFRQADELRVRSADRHGGNGLVELDSGDTGAEPVHHSDEVPTRGKWHARRFGMDALARHDVG
jgi:hypothetical protein